MSCLCNGLACMTMLHNPKTNLVYTRFGESCLQALVVMFKFANLHGIKSDLFQRNTSCKKDIHKVISISPFWNNIIML